MSFKAGAHPGGDLQGSAHWFVFQDNRLLVRLEQDQATVPFVEQIGCLDIEPLRIQYIGTLDGNPCFSAELNSELPAPAGMRFEQLRQLWGLLPEELFWVAGRAFQIMNWDRNSQFCGRCGGPMEVKQEERAKICPGCGSFSYPRICPAIIVAITRDSSILLARARRFPAALYSVIAGFVEPGESLEDCVHREVHEEVGITVKNLRYFGSQSWPFPHSLMVAFTAEHAGGEIQIDQTEIVEAGWYTVDALPRIPESLSIARRLIDSFVEKQADR